MSDLLSIEELAKQCLLPKLSKTYDECEYHHEYQLRDNQLEEHLQNLLYLLAKTDFLQPSESISSAISSVLMLYLELQSKTFTNIENSQAKEHKIKLDQTFKEKYKITLNEILKLDVFNAQEIFEVTLKELHKKMTSDDFKKYPGLIHVYCMLMKDINNCRVKLNPASVLPIALMLMEDYIINNKIKGLQCCSALLQSLTNADFSNGNYYEVVYSSLQKNITEKDIDVTKLLLECILELLKILPLDVKKNKLDDVFSIILDQMLTESNLDRKKECFIFITKIIHMHGINCVKRKIFKNIICDNIDICTEEAVREILLQHVIECLQTWIKYCWPVWKLSSDQKLLSSLFKIMYICEDDVIIKEIQHLIIILISLSTKDEQEQICKNLEALPESEHSKPMFLKSIQTIKESIKPQYRYSKLIMRAAHPVSRHICSYWSTSL